MATVAAVSRSALLAALASSSLVHVAGAQPSLPERPTSSDVRARADGIVESAERRLRCEIAIHGDPRPEPSDGQWLVAYSASGEACDAAADALREQGLALGIVFFRRPNRDEAVVLINRMRRSVEGAYGCRISIRGEPALDEQSIWWQVSYIASGVNCGDAAEDLRLQGSPLMISFAPVSGRGELLR
jgi:hypothetical protein